MAYLSPPQLGLKFYRFAVQLKQICNFHNHLASEILPCQKLMVLNAAVRFEKLFNNSDKANAANSLQRMSWSNVQEASNRPNIDWQEKIHRGILRDLRNISETA